MYVTEERLEISGWPTDVISIEHDARSTNRSQKPNTLILFIPGNPGVIHWYIDFLSKILQTLGHGYAVKGVSYAGHGVGDEIVGSDEDHNCYSEHSGSVDLNGRFDKMKTAWTMDGQGEIERRIVHYSIMFFMLNKFIFPKTLLNVT